MQIAKQSLYNSGSSNNSKLSRFDVHKTAAEKETDVNALKDYAKSADNDLLNIFTVFKGRVRFGDGTNGERGENISGEFRVFTTSATPNAENIITHTIGAIPIGFIVINKNKAGDLYAGTTAWTSTTVALKCSVASVLYTIFLLK